MKLPLRPCAAASLALALSLLIPAGQPLHAQTNDLATAHGTITFADTGIGNNTLHGRLFSSDYFLPGPGEFPLAPTGSVVALHYISSGVAGPESVLTVYWNDVPVRDVHLSGSSQPETLLVPLPVSLIKKGVNKLSLDGSMQPENTQCAQDNPADHFTVLKSSTIHYQLSSNEPRPTVMAPDLANYPAPFFETDPLSPSNIAFVLPRSPSTDVLAAAAEVSAGLGRMAGAQTLHIQEIADTGSLPSRLAQSNFIYVGGAAELPGLRNLAGLPLTRGPKGSWLENGTAPPADSGVLMEMASPLNPGRMILVVTGQSGAALSTAATAISSFAPSKLIAGPSAIVSGLALGGPPPAAIGAGNTKLLTLAQLGRADQTVNGTGDHTITFKVELPGTPPAGESLSLNLVISHSPLVDPATSSVRVILNGRSLTSVLMKQIRPTRGDVQLTLPTSAILPGVNTFDVVFTMRLNTAPVLQGCPAPPTEQAWAVLHASSSIQLPSRFTAPSQVSFSDYPYPFVGSDGFRQTAFVVPDRFDPGPFLTFNAGLGRSLRSDTPPPRVLLASAFKPSESNRNLIVWGAPADNPLISELNDYLPLVVTSTQPRHFAFAGNLRVSVRDSAALGVAQEILSPWNAGKRILVVSGTDAGTVALAVRGLEQPNLQNNLALMSLDTLATPTPGEPPPISVTTYQIAALRQAASGRLGIGLVPIALAAGLSLLALGMALSMAYQAFVREPRDRQ